VESTFDQVNKKIKLLVGKCLQMIRICKELLRKSGLIALQQHKRPANLRWQAFVWASHELAMRGMQERHTGHVQTLT
jgi:hypothetical protein